MSRPDDPVARLSRHLDQAPPPELRDLALARAERVLRHPAPRDGWRRLWESRPLRLAWSAAVVALIAANVAIRRPQGRPEPLREAPRAGLSPEVEEAVGLPRLNPLYATMDAAVAAAPPSSDASSDETVNYEETTS